MFPKRFERYHYIDYLRGFMVLLVVLDHSMHAYAPTFKRFWYIPDFGGSLFFDLWHLHNDAIMMPMLFFLSGLFVLGSLKRRGFLDFSREKFFRLVVPFFLGVAILVPPQTYGKYITFTDPDISYFHYLTEIFFFDRLSLSGFWFLSMLFAFTYVLLLISWIAPWVLKGFEAIAAGLKKNPLRYVLLIFGIVAIIMGLSDLYWGAHWAVKFNMFFVAIRGSRFLTHAFLFFLGAGIANIGLHKDQDFLDKLGQKWFHLLLLTLGIGTVYMSYVLLNFTQAAGPFNIEVLRAIRQGASIGDIIDVASFYAPPVLLRTTLLSGFILSLIATYIAGFYRFLNHESALWQSLAHCSFGMYIFHEPVTVWIHIFFFETATSEFIKFAITASLSVAFGWGLTKLLRPLPGFRRVL